MALESAPTASEQSEPVTQSVANFLGAHRHHSRRGQLDGECNSVQTVADLLDGFDRARIVEGEIRCGGRGTLDEQ